MTVLTVPQVADSAASKQHPAVRFPVAARAEYTVKARETVQLRLGYEAGEHLAKLELGGFEGTKVKVSLNLAHLLELLEQAALAMAAEPGAIGADTVAKSDRLTNVLDQLQSGAYQARKAEWLAQQAKAAGDPELASIREREAKAYRKVRGASA